MVGNLIIPLTPEYIFQALDIALTRENYHKGPHFKEKSWTFFLEKNRKGSFDRTKGISREWFNERWGELVLIIKKPFTCDRGHSVAYLYHVKLLQHIKREEKINLSYLFFRNLIKMIKSVKNENKPKEAQVYY